MPGATAHFTQTPRLPSEVVPGLAFEVSAAVLRAMAPDALRRFASMGEVADALRPLPREHTPNASPVAMPPPRAAAEPPGAAPHRPRRGVLVLALLLVLGGATVITAAVIALLRPPPPAVLAAPSVPPQPSLHAAPAPSADSIGAEPARPQGEPSTPPRTAHDATPPIARPQQLGANHGTRCECLGKAGALCTPNASREARVCRCLDLSSPADDCRELSLEPAWDLSRTAYRGRNVRDGQPCKGFDNGQEKAGALAACEVDCDRMAFSGLHRGPCTGFRPADGAAEAGYLLCF